jgi:hypothetical protein
MVSLSEGLAMLSLMTSAAMHGSSGLNRPPFLGVLVLQFLCPLAFLSALRQYIWASGRCLVRGPFVVCTISHGFWVHISDLRWYIFGHSMRFISHSNYHKSTRGTTVPVWCVVVPD